MSKLKLLYQGLRVFYLTHFYNCNPKNYMKAGKHVNLKPPLYVIPGRIELEDYTRIQAYTKVTISPRQKLIIKKYAAVASGCTIVPGNHTPTVSSPQYLSYIGVNDINNTLIIEEDAWIGTNSTLLYKGSIGRGAVVGAGSIVTKKVPPYAVVSGIPAKVIAVRFSIEQIIEHERHLYPENERLKREYLEELFNTEYQGKKIIGTDSISINDIDLLNQEKRRKNMKDYFNE